MKRRMPSWGASFGGGRSSDSVAMASGPPDATANQEPAEAAEECSGKKKSKFQTFKKFFARKKKKEASATGGEAGLKGSQSSDNVSKTPDDNTLTRSDKDKGSGSKISLGSKALSHDSVFVSDSSEANEALGASQDSIHGKVKSLQLQLKQAIRLGSPPSLMCVKRTEDAGAMSEDDGLPCSPPEYSTSHTNQAQTNSSLSLEGTDSDEDQLSCAASSRAVSPLVAVPGDFSQPASPFACLDNTAAKHKLGLRHKACNKRKPASRLEIRPEGDSVVEERLSTTIPEALEEREEQETRDVRSDQVKPKEEEEEEGKEEEEETDQTHSKQTLLRDKDNEEEEEEEEEKGEDELEAEQNVSHGPEASSPLDRRLSEGEAADASSKPSSRSSSSLDGLRATPEPPAGQREYLLDPPGVAYGTERTRVESDSALGGEEDGVLSNIGGEEEEKESSFLQEVLSSLKTPLTSCSLGLETDGVVLELDEGVEESETEVEDASKVEEKEKEEVEAEEGEEVAEEEADEEEPVNHQAPPSGSMPLLLGQPTQEEEVLSGTVSSYQAIEKEDDEDEDEEEGDSEEEVVEQFLQHAQEEEREKGESQEPEYCTKEEENDLPIRKSDKREGEEAESEGEEEAIELEKEPEVEEEGCDKREEDEEEEKEETEGKERVEEAEEAVEEEEDSGEEMTEMVPDEIGEMVQIAMPVPEADQGLDVVLGEDTVFTLEQAGQVQIPTEMRDQTESQTASNQNFVDEREDEEEREDEGVEIDQTEEKSDQEEDMETNHPDVDQNEQSDQAGLETDRLDEDQLGVEMSHLGMDRMEEDQRDPEQTDVDQTEFTPSSVSLPDSSDFSETQTQEESETSVPSPTSPTTSTTVLHINLVSPSSEKATSPLRQFFSGADTAKEVNQSSSHIAATAEQSEKSQPSSAEEPADTEGGRKEEEEEEEEGKQSQATTEEEEAQPAPKPSAAVEEEAVTQPSSASDKSKARFTITPAWQRSLSTGIGSTTESVIPPSPSSPPPCVSSIVSTSPSATRHRGAEVMATTKKEPLVKVEQVSLAKAEVVLSPGRTRSVGSTPAKPLSTTTAAPTKPQTSTAATTEESTVVVEGNPENPFGVRLRKTAVLHRFGSEDENTEPALEPVAQPNNNKVDTPQPSRVKPSITQPVSIKPALPKKPEALGDSGGKIKHTDQAASRSFSAGSDSPSWISVARQKQKIYKDSSLDETTAKKEEPERKSSLPLYVSSAACREHNKTLESTSKVSQLEITKPAAPVEKEKEVRRALSPPTPVPPQPAKSQPLPCPVAPKLSSQVTPAAPKHPSQIALSPPTPVPVPQRAPSCTSPPSPSKTPPSQPQSSTPFTHSPPPQPSSAVTSLPFSSRPSPVPPRAPSQRGLPSPGSPPPALSQDEPPWMALAKKKAKAWSEMPQIVQ